MTNKALIDKSIVKQIKTSNISPIRARQISNALRTIDTSNIQTMTVTGKIKKLSVNSEFPVYMYRVNLKDRIIFSEIDNKRVIHKLINID